MTDEEMMDLVARFREAFRSEDPAKLSQVLTNDFEWHQHFADGPGARPTGRIAYGVEGMVEVLEWRKKN